MVKLLLCLFSCLALALVMLQLRQQELNLNFETNRLHGQIEAQQAQLWNQQLRIAEETGPNSIVQKVKEDKIPLGPGGNGMIETGVDQGQGAE
jgi:cell division protein FtsL